MFCPNCGNHCQEANFCQNCGYDLRNVQPEAQSNSEEIQETEIILAPDDFVGYYGSGNCIMKLESEKAVFKNNKLGSEISIPYTNIGKVIISRASPAKNGYLIFRSWENRFNQIPTVDKIDSDKTSITFSVSDNSRIYQVYLFLKKCADQQMVDHAGKVQEDENGKGYSPAQVIESAPETFDVDNLAWYPGKGKHDRKAKIAELEKSGQVYCPKCLSTSITANQKGFGFVRGALGANFGLDIGMIAGGIGSKKIICTCLKCGYQWKPGKK